MTAYWDFVKRVIRDADILLEVLDARFIEESRNREIEQKVKYAKKTLIYVFNKCDLVSDRNLLAKYKRELRPSVFVSSTEKQGTRMLKEAILKNADSKKKTVFVGLLGYPNTGKSTLINALGGGGKASTSPSSGHTKGAQYIRINQRIKLIDTPGVFSYKEPDQDKHAVIGAIGTNKIKDQEYAFYHLHQKYKNDIISYYEIEDSDDPDEVLETIALNNNLLLKGGRPDTLRAARMVIGDWQRGKIHAKKSN
jgi:ribosome biogenesis GTPase A